MVNTILCLELGFNNLDVTADLSKNAFTNTEAKANSIRIQGLACFEFSKGLKEMHHVFLADADTLVGYC